MSPSKQEVKPSKKDLIIFSLIWAVIFLIIGIYPFIKNLFNGSQSAVLSDFLVWSLLISSIFLIISFSVPGILLNFYKIWMKFGELIGGVISKVVLLILFYTVFTPVAIILKLLGKDLLNKKLNKKATTYWEDRSSQPGSLKKQF